MEDLHTREADEEDLDVVLELERDGFSNPWPRSAFEEELRTPYASLVLAERDGVVVGFVDYWVVEDELHLLVLTVRAADRRKGIGDFLLELAESDAREKGVAYCVLEVRVGNTAARAFYERVGYRQVGVRKKYYRDTSEDALVLMKDLVERP